MPSLNTYPSISCFIWAILQLCPVSTKPEKRMKFIDSTQNSALFKALLYVPRKNVQTAVIDGAAVNEQRDCSTETTALKVWSIRWSRVLGKRPRRHIYLWFMVTRWSLAITSSDIDWPLQSVPATINKIWHQRERERRMERYIYNHSEMQQDTSVSQLQDV